MTRNFDDAGLQIDGIIPFDGPKHSGVDIEWSSSQIGFGHYTLYFDKTDGCLYADSETMDAENDLSFLETLMDLVKQLIVSRVIVSG